MEFSNRGSSCTYTCIDFYLFQTSKLHHKFSPVGWVLDKSSIFAQIDAFVQRCKDLLEVGIYDSNDPFTLHDRKKQKQTNIFFHTKLPLPGVKFY